jgi:hypothetical protein
MKAFNTESDEHDVQSCENMNINLMVFIVTFNNLQGATTAASNFYKKITNIFSLYYFTTTE